ncbi:histidine kinase [Salipaludibacillus sp. CUR1]|uniref:sensor histidine kinase n=1 Tax=Salipaludibacillus sp. CUR1 TaxID=2820003 RepID=UPI001E4C0653|nr:ATP-binding protein [Salipaludibacillus sp. CUR1]MCE7792379.1 histidine kinase [Salipaludibacillus sp. CUR1]
MFFFNNVLRHIVLVARWVFLLILITFDILTPWSMLLLLIINLAMLLLLYKRIENRFWVMLVLFEAGLLASMTLLTGALEPYKLLYLSSTLYIALSSLSSNKYTYIGSFIFFATAIFITGRVTGFNEEVSPALFAALLVPVVLYILLHIISRKAFKVYKHWRAISFFILNSHKHKDLSQCQEIAENLVEQIFATGKVYICRNDKSSDMTDWHRHYFKRRLFDKGFFNSHAKTFIKLPDHAGNDRTFYFFPVRSKGEESNRFVILLPVSRRPVKNAFSDLYLHMISAVLINKQCMSEEMARMQEAMKKDLSDKLASDMHDGLAQKLFFLSAQTFKTRLLVRNSEAPHTIEKNIDEVEESIQQCHLEVREYIAYLREEHKRENVLDALESLLNRLMQQSDMAYSYTAQGKVLNESLETEEAVYRVTEEMVSNCIKHSKATTMTLQVKVNAIQWVIKVTDNGVGFRKSQKVNKQRKGYAGGTGLKGLRERAEKLGGTFSIRDLNRSGTEAVVIIPRGG